MNCRKCGTPLADGESLCPKCGTEQNVTVSLNRDTSVSSNIVIGSLLVIILVLAGASYFLNGWILPPSGLQAGIAAKDAKSDGNYFIWTFYDPDTEEVEGIIVKIDSSGNSTIMSEVEEDGTAEEFCELNGNVSSGVMKLSAGEDDWDAGGSFIENPDGSWTGLMDVKSEEGYGSSYTKLLPVTPAGGDKWKILTTGETLTYDEICYGDFSDTKAGSQFKMEAEPFTTYTEYETSSTPKPSVNPLPSTPAPSSKNNDVTIPDDVMRTYVTYELENIEHEYNKVPVSNHIKMPNDREQQRFEALIEEELWGDRLDFWRENKHKWYK